MCVHVFICIYTMFYFELCAHGPPKKNKRTQQILDQQFFEHLAFCIFCFCLCNLLTHLQPPARLATTPALPLKGADHRLPPPRAAPPPQGGDHRPHRPLRAATTTPAPPHQGGDHRPRHPPRRPPPATLIVSRFAPHTNKLPVRHRRARRQAPRAIL